MRVASLLATLAVVAVACPAVAQNPLSAGLPINSDKTKSEEQIAKEKATEDAYKATLRKIPDAKPADPWGNMRSDDKPKTPAKNQAKNQTGDQTKAAKKTGAAAAN